MVDIVDTATRSRMMAAVKGRNTGPEIELRALLTKAGLRGYRLHRRDIPGCPDLAWVGRRLAVFVDGAFWHGHPRAFSPGKSGRFWDEKIARNQARDAAVNAQLASSGWAVLRFWDFEIRDCPTSVVDQIRKSLRPASSDART